ncbi:TIGR02117 family protein [Craurococcus roseus]|uniref:TIGR02117 family protein n=1 Tax=Craurococcus roseus TaxID=77585 RepID=A0ABN1ENH1_9PROT
MLAGCAAAGVAAASCSATGSLPRSDAGGARTRAVHLVARAWHTDVDLPADRLPPALLPLAQDFPGATHFLFGFGERAYWTKPEPSSTDALAALIPGPGVILVTALRAPPPAAFPPKDVVVLPVAEEGLDRLGAFLKAELREDGEFRRMADGPYPGSRFYATSRRYSAAYTCNTWVADALHVAGTGVAPAGILFAGQLMRRARAAADAAGRQPALARTPLAPAHRAVP